MTLEKIVEWLSLIGAVLYVGVTLWMTGVVLYLLLVGESWAALVMFLVVVPWWGLLAKCWRDSGKQSRKKGDTE